MSDMTARPARIVVLVENEPDRIQQLWNVMMDQTRGRPYRTIRDGARELALGVTEPPLFVFVPRSADLEGMLADLCKDFPGIEGRIYSSTSMYTSPAPLLNALDEIVFRRCRDAQILILWDEHLDTAWPTHAEADTPPDRKGSKLAGTARVALEYAERVRDRADDRVRIVPVTAHAWPDERTLQVLDGVRAGRLERPAVAGRESPGVQVARHFENRARYECVNVRLRSIPRVEASATSRNVWQLRTLWMPRDEVADLRLALESAMHEDCDIIHRFLRTQLVRDRGHALDLAPLDPVHICPLFVDEELGTIEIFEHELREKLAKASGDRDTLSVYREQLLNRLQGDLDGFLKGLGWRSVGGSLLTQDRERYTLFRYLLFRGEVSSSKQLCRNNPDFKLETEAGRTRGFNGYGTPNHAQVDIHRIRHLTRREELVASRGQRGSGYWCARNFVLIESRPTRE